MISDSESLFLKYLRGLSILVIVFGHVGGFWFYEPYSRFLLTFNALFFFISGAASIYSYDRAATLLTYLKKRLAGLLIPYYLLCLVSLLFVFAKESSIPQLNISHLLAWITITPSNAMMPFPIGQIWFLNALLVIVLISPLCFYLHKKNVAYTFLIIGLGLMLSFIQHFYNISSILSVSGIDLYKPAFYLSFYCMGFLFVTKKSIYSHKILLCINIIALACCLSFILIFHVSVSYLHHAFPPDMYYAAGSIFLISSVLLLKDSLISFFRKKSFIASVLSFFYVHTFSVFLLHTLGIYIFEICLNTQFREKNTMYGIIKLGTVLTITCIFAVPFTYASSQINRYLFQQRKTGLFFK